MRSVCFSAHALCAATSGTISSWPASTPAITDAAMSWAVSGEDSTRWATTPARAVSAPCIDAQQVGAEVRRADDAGADAVRRQLVAGRLGERDDGGLDRVVGRHAGGVHEPGERGDVDDVPGPLALEQRHERAGAADDAEQVDLGDPAPLVEGGDVEPAAARDAGVVDQDVEPAPAGLDLLEGGGPVVVVGDVEGQVDVVRRRGPSRARRRRAARQAARSGRRAETYRSASAGDEESRVMRTCPARGGRPCRDAPRRGRRPAAACGR